MITDCFAHVVPLYFFHARAEVAEFDDGLVQDFLFPGCEVRTGSGIDWETNLDSDALLLQIGLAFVLAGIQLHLDPEMGVRGGRGERVGRTYSCLRFPRSCFILTSSLSTSLRRAAMVARMAVLSFRDRALSSALNSDTAARKRYACYSEWVTSVG